MSQDEDEGDVPLNDTSESTEEEKPAETVPNVAESDNVITSSSHSSVAHAQKANGAVSTATVGPEHSASSIYADCFLIFRELCKLSMKDLPPS